MGRSASGDASLSRPVIAARAACTASILLLTLTVTHGTGLQAALLLVAVAAAVTGLEGTNGIATAWILIAEAVATGLLIGADLPSTAICLPYLLIPPLAAGCSGGARLVSWVSFAELVTVYTPVLLAGHIYAAVDFAPQLAPWWLTSLGVGCLGARLRAIGPVRRGDDASYESARRLIGRLHGVAGRLPAGFDVSGVAERILDEVDGLVSPLSSLVILRGATGELTPLAQRGIGCDLVAPVSTELINECTHSGRPTQQQLHIDDQGGPFLIALPLVTDHAVIGSVIMQMPSRRSPRWLSTVMELLDRHSLRLDTAVAFEEVRRVATSEERHRVAGEIHDGIAQEAAALRYVVDELSAGTNTEEQRVKLARLRTDLERLVRELRLSIFDLRTDTSPATDLSAALVSYARHISSSTTLTVHPSVEQSGRRLTPDKEAELFRIAQEAMTNARKHSGGKNIWVTCCFDPPDGTLIVEDDGRWLLAKRQDSFGLRLMRERAERINATIAIGPRPGGGTSVVVTFRDDPQRCYPSSERPDLSMQGRRGYAYQSAARG